MLFFFNLLFSSGGSTGLLHSKEGEKGKRGREERKSIKRAMEKNLRKIYGSYIATERL